jgi:hypothetical protein
MSIIGQIFLGLIIIAVGVLTLLKNYQVANTIPLKWFEQKMGTGSSYTIWKLLSAAMIFVGFAVMFGFMDNILSLILSPLTNTISSN